MVQFVNSRCSSLMLNHHSITKLIISLTLTLLQCYYFNTLGVDYIYTGSVDLTLEVLLCSLHYKAMFTLGVFFEAAGVCFTL